MTAIQLRPAHVADAPALAELGARAFVAKFGHLYRPDDLAGFLDEAHSPRKVTAEIGDPAMAVVLAHDATGALLGFCKLHLAADWPEHARGDTVVTLKQLYTDPDLTGRGTGTVLMDWALAHARGRGADEMQLSVYAENEGAQRFYRRYGFARLADIFFMVGDHRDDEFLYAMML